MDNLWIEYGPTMAYGIVTKADDEGVLYLKEEGNEVVIEIVGQTAYGFYRVAGETAFTAENATQEDLNYVLEAFNALASFSKPQEGVQYKQVADVVAATGDAYAYEAYSEGQLTGVLLIDKATGIPVKVTLADGTVTMEATALSTTATQIPAYK